MVPWGRGGRSWGPLGHAITDPNGAVQRYGYDAVGRLTQVLDSAGNVATQTDYNGATTTFTYDANGRTTRIDYADGSFESFTYDDNGNRQTATNAQGTTSYQYDELNRLVRETKPDGSALTYAYDANGNKTRVTVSGHGKTATTRYTYDALMNRLATVTDEQGGVTTHTYDAAGNLKTLAFPNGFVTTYNYDDLNRPLSVITKNAQGTIVGSETYTLHPTGRRLQVASFDGTATTTQQYRYDVLYRLFEETITDAQGTTTNSYTYDKVGNRVYGIEDGVHTQYAYDANDRLLSAGGVSYTYDAAGNVLTETEDGQTRTYTWNAQQKLAQASTPSGLIDYLYDVDGIRSAKTVNGSTTNYVVDHNTAYAQVLLEADQTGNTAAYTRGLALLGQERNGATNYYHADALGSTKQLSDNSGAVTDQYAYTAFGKQRSATGSTANSYRFTGEQFDEGLGQYYLRARNYDPRIGRFTGRDPFAGIDAQPNTLHDYMYAGSDPVDNADPTGEMFTLGGQMSALGVRSSVNSAVFNSLSRGFFTSFIRSAQTQIIHVSGKLASKSLRRAIRKGMRGAFDTHILIVGGDNPNAAQHIDDAQSGRGSAAPQRAPWDLTYSGATGSRSLLKSISHCAKSARDFGSALYAGPVECDEYPFNASKQGGRSYTSYRLIPMLENRRVGGHLRALTILGKMKRNDRFLVIAERSIPNTIAIPAFGIRNEWGCQVNLDRLEFTHNFYYGKSKASLKKVVLRIYEVIPDEAGGYAYRLAMDGLYDQAGSHRVESLFYLARDVVRAAHGLVCELVESNPDAKVYFEFDGEIVHLKDFSQIFLIPMEWPV